MAHVRRSTLLGGIGVAGLVITTASIAFACTTYVGKLTVKGNGGSGTSVAQGNNNCDSTCGASNGSMKWCGTFTTGAQATSTSGTITVKMETSTVCNAQYGHGESHLTPNATYDVNYRAGNLMSASDTTIVDAQDCMSWTLGNGTVRLGRATSDGGGSFTFNTNLTSPTSVNQTSPAKYAAICVSDTPSFWGNQAALQIIA